MILQNIARNHKDPTFNYPVRYIEDRYMQALACFIGAGKRSNILAKSIRDDSVSTPELALALYGSLVGYSMFHRIFFDLRNFVPQPPLPPPPLPPPPPPPTPPPAMTTEILPDWKSRILNAAREILANTNIRSKKKKNDLDNSLSQALSECTNRQQLIPLLLMRKVWGERTTAFKKLRKYIQDTEESLPLSDDVAQHFVNKEVERGSDLLIDDANLVNCMEHFLSTQTKLQERDRKRILEDLQFLQREYSPGGRYSANEAKNPRDNKSTIRHLTNLINMHVQLSETIKDSLYSFLRQRYFSEENNR